MVIDSDPVVESVESTPEPRNATLMLLLKAVVATIAIFFGLALITVVILGLIFYRYFSQFSEASGLSWTNSRQLLAQSLAIKPLATGQQKTILLLGTDSLATRGDVPPLTDTIQLISVNLGSGQVHSLSLPRDIYSSAYQTKINALYAYGFDYIPDKPELFPQQVVSELTDRTIQHTLVISLDQLGELIELVGGVEIDVPTGFVDEQFPKTDVNIATETDPNLLYERVEFLAGPQLMTSDRALKYIRSRHAEGDAGTDLSRSARQQQVIEALLTKLMSLKTFLSPVTAGSLFKYYQTNFERYVSVQEVIATALVLVDKRNQIEFIPQQLSIYPENPEGVLVNPPEERYDGQWVYEIRDLSAFQTEVKELLAKPK